MPHDAGSCGTLMVPGARHAGGLRDFGRPFADHRRPTRRSPPARGRAARPTCRQSRRRAHSRAQGASEQLISGGAPFGTVALQAVGEPGHIRGEQEVEVAEPFARALLDPGGARAVIVVRVDHGADEIGVFHQGVGESGCAPRLPGRSDRARSVRRRPRRAARPCDRRRSARIRETRRRQPHRQLTGQRRLAGALRAGQDDNEGTGGSRRRDLRHSTNPMPASTRNTR